MKKVISILLAVILLSGWAVMSGVTVSAEGIKTGTLVTFGSYPQSSVIDPSLLDELNAQPVTWTYYDYYCDGKKEDYMKYADITLSGDHYRAVTFKHYRPYDWKYSGDAEYSFQDDNGYEPNKVYWFKYEPIVWRVLYAPNGFLVAENLLDSQPFHNVYYYNGGYCYGDEIHAHYASLWSYSSLRAWLNSDFYNTAFDFEKSNIYTTSFTYTSNYSPSYVVESKKNNVFLLSESDVLNTAYGFSSNVDSGKDYRIAYGTDYARCQGLKVMYSSGSSYDGASWWRLSTPHNSYFNDYVEYTGQVIHGHAYTHYTDGGIRPALNVDLQSEISRSVIKITDKSGLVVNGPADTVTSTHSLAHIAAKTPTCIASGSIEYYYCGDCGKCFLDENADIGIMSADIILPATGMHTWDDGKVTSNATCTTTGEKTYTCNVCKKTKTEFIDKDADNHTGGTEIVNKKAENCGMEGYTGDTYCKGCGAMISTGTAVPATGKHTWDDGKITTAATCNATGKLIYTCKICNRTRIETIAAAGHKLSETAAKTATCTEDGNVQFYTCSECGKIFTDEDGTKEIKDVAVKAAGHDFGEWKVTKEATVDEGGIETRKCSKCGEEETRLIKKLEIKVTPGDVDGNGQILADDARLALRFSAKLEEPDENQQKAADVDGNGQVLADDARQILRFSAKLQLEFLKK